MQKYELILLDMDGTIFDFDACEQNSFFAAMSDLNITVSLKDFENYLIINQSLWRELEQGSINSHELRILRFKRFLKLINITADAKTASDTYIKYLSQNSQLFSGAEEFCRRLHADFKICIVTNGIKINQYKRIKNSAISHYIDYIIVSEEADAAKPDPEIFRQALIRVGHSDKKTCILIGDSYPADIIGAKNFGIDSIWYNPKNKEAPENISTYTVKTYDEILELLNQKNE